jgi:hypothetical protein
MISTVLDTRVATHELILAKNKDKGKTFNAARSEVN